EEEYEVSVLAANCAQLKEDDIKEILENVLLQFPVMEVCFNLPNWLDTLEFDHYIKKDLSNAFKAMMKNINKIDDVKKAVELLEDSPYIRKAYVDEISLGDGSAVAEIAMEDGLFYKVLSETLNIPLENDYQLISVIKELSGVREGYEKMKLAMADAQRKGYGIVVPQFSDIVLDEPELYRQGSRYGIRLKAKGRSMHLIKADIEAEVNPIIGSEEQTISYIEELKKEYKENPQKIWELNLFGRSLESLVTEGMNNKLYRMPQDAQFKLQETLEKIINEGSGGLICILL
ncbi:MAG: stage IV sporulation protein A, partial [Lachnospiraceae bacterium]|nr:stage IV sporulation protein A [Lachnospiraceae bacterium]